VLVGLPQGVDGPAILYHINLILVYFYNTHQVLVGLPQGVGGLAILCDFISVYFSLFLYHAQSARGARRGLVEKECTSLY
jgi:hypothetical protein